MDLDTLRAALAGRVTPAEAAALVVLTAGVVALVLAVVLWLVGDGPPGAAAPVGPHVDITPPEAAGGEPSADGGAGLAVSSPVEQSATVVVDVSGQVRRPGLVELPAGSRVADALEVVGGVNPGVDPGVNRARVLVDGELIVIGEPPGGTSGGGPADEGPPLTPAGLLDLNRASHADLDALPGVGPVTADKILAHRDEIGGYTDVIQLLEVSGIGASRFAELEEVVGV